MEDQSIVSAIVGAALGAFTAWALIRIVTYIVIRRRLINYIITISNVYLGAMHGNNEWLLKFVKHNLKVNETIDGAPFYTQEEFQNLKSINVDHLLYLKKDEQKRITYMLANMMELEILFYGFCYSALELQNQKCKLPKKKFDFMNSRAERIHALVNLFPKQISKIDDLLDVYDSKIPPEALVKGVRKESRSKKWPWENLWLGH